MKRIDIWMYDGGIKASRVVIALTDMAFFEDSFYRGEAKYLGDEEIKILYEFESDRALIRKVRGGGKCWLNLRQL